MRDSEWTGPSPAEVLEAPELPWGVQIGRPHLHERVLARDRSGDHPHAAVAAARDGAAWWTCPVDGSPVARVGAHPG